MQLMQLTKNWETYCDENDLSGDEKAKIID